MLVGRMRVSHQVRKKASSARATCEERVRGKLTLYMVDDMGWVGRKIHHRVWLNFISPHPLAAGTAYSRSIFPCHPASLQKPQRCLAISHRYRFRVRESGIGS